MTIKKRPHSITFTEPSKTQQGCADECNINTIIKRYAATGVIDHVQSNVGQYGDFSEIQNYQKSLNQIAHAESLFMDLPASVRKHFDNDPIEFVTFASNPDNIDVLVELGLANKPKKSEPKTTTPKAPVSPSNEPIKDAAPLATPDPS